MNEIKPRDEAHLERRRERLAGTLNAPIPHPKIPSAEDDDILGHAGKNERWMILHRAIQEDRLAP